MKIILGDGVCNNICWTYRLSLRGMNNQNWAQFSMDETRQKNVSEKGYWYAPTVGA